MLTLNKIKRGTVPLLQNEEGLETLTMMVKTW